MEKNALEMAKNGGFNLIQEGEFTYIDEGEGDVLLLLHGLFCPGSSGSVWLNYMFCGPTSRPGWSHPSLGIRRRRGIWHKHPATCGIMCGDPH